MYLHHAHRPVVHSRIFPTVIPFEITSVPRSPDEVLGSHASRGAVCIGLIFLGGASTVKDDHGVAEVSKRRKDKSGASLESPKKQQRNMR